MAELTPEQIRLEQERLALLQEQSAAAKELASTYDKMAKSGANLSANEKEILGLTKQLSVFASQIEDTAQKRISSTSTVKELSKSIEKLEADVYRNQALYGNTVAKINAEKQKALQSALSLHRQEQNIQNDIKQQLELQDNIQSEIELLKNSTLQSDKDRVKSLKEQLRENNNTLNVLEKNLKKTTDQKDAQKDLYKQLDASKKAYEKITAEQQKELDLAKEALKQKKKEEILDTLKTKLLGDNLKTIKEMFTLGSIIDMLFKGSENIANFRKELGMSYGNAYELNNELSEVGRQVSDAYVTGEKLKKSFADLSKEMGFVANYGSQSLVTMTNLTGRLGMTNKEAAQLTTLSRFQSQDTEKVLDNVGKTVTSMNKQKGTSILLKDVMKDIGNVSMATAVSLGKNPVAIAEAVVAARQLGTTLEQMEKTADSLLNFETSIENELKAELLTGKQMNLERARAAALSNDMKTLTEEIGKNQEVIDTFSKGNRLEQQAVAEALGMSREDLAKMVYQQEAMKIGAEGVRAKYGEQAYEQLKAQNAQEKFTNAVEKLKAAFSGIIQILTPILDAIAWLAEGVSSLTSTWWGMSLAIGAIALMYLPKLIGGFASMAGSVKDMAKNAMSLFSKGGIKNLLGGGATEKVVPEAPIPGTKGAGGLGGFMDKMPSASSMLKGAAAILVLAGALFVAAKAFQEFAKVKWEDMGKAAVALTGLSIVAIILGKAKGAILEGAIAIAILGAGLIPLAFALRIAAPAIEAFGKVVTAVFNGLATVITAAAGGIATIFGSLQNVDVAKLLAIGPALTMIGIGLASLGAGGVIGAIGAFLTGDPIKKIQKLAESGDGLQKAATGLQGMAGALTQVSAALAAIDISKIEALEGFATKMTVGSVVKGITDFITAPIKAVGTMVEGATGGGENDAMIKAINEVRDEVKKLYAKDTTINMDGKKVGTTLTQSSTKLA